MISTAAVQLLREYTGRGPTKAKTLINDDVVTVLLADTLTKGERKLVDSGRSDRVLQLRHDYQLTMRDDLIAIVERQLDRKVIAFMSQNHIDPDLAVEVFVLEPDGAGQPRAGRSRRAEPRRRVRAEALRLAVHDPEPDSLGCGAVPGRVGCASDGAVAAGSQGATAEPAAELGAVRALLAGPGERADGAVARTALGSPQLGRGAHAAAVPSAAR